MVYISLIEFITTGHISVSQQLENSHHLEFVQNNKLHVPYKQHPHKKEQLKLPFWWALFSQFVTMGHKPLPPDFAEEY